MSKLELNIIPSGWDLPSCDLHCIIAAAQIKFLGVPLKLVNTRNPYFTPNGSLPLLTDGHITISKYSDIMKHLSENHKVDSHLTVQQKADACMFSQYVDIQLFPCLQYMLWADEINYSENIRPHYAKLLPFPFNYYYPGKYQQDGVKYVESIFSDAESQTVNLKIYQRAEECFKVISERLGKNEFLLGDRPSSVDAVVFGYCALFARAPQKNKMLANTLRATENLDRFVTRIMQRYFPTIQQDYITHNKEKAKIELEKKDGVPNSTRNKFLAALFAVIAMGGFAISNGILPFAKGGVPDSFLKNHRIRHRKRKPVPE